MSVNFSNTTPAAVAGNTNVSWQTDGSGNISGYVPNAATNTSPINLTAQGANISATTILTPAVAGVYRVSAYIIVTRAATTSSTLPSVTISWTDANNATGQTFLLTPTNAGNLLTTFQQNTMVLNSATNAIQYTVASYASVGGTSMQFALAIRTESLG
jgi:hypothetical protein